MEFLTDSLIETVSKLNENQKEEIDVIESIIRANETNKENTKEKLFRYVEKRKPENSINFILQCITYAALVRIKERESHLFLLTSVFNNFHLNFNLARNSDILLHMLQVKNILPSDENTLRHIFDFADEGTVERAIFEDDIDSLQRLLSLHPDEGKEQNIVIGNYQLYNEFKRIRVNRIELSALFGSIKCFKYLMMIEDNVNEETCKFAVAGGNIEIIHLCEQKGHHFENCLLISVLYHLYDIFEWLNTHFNYNEISLSVLINYFNEPLFYFYSLSGANFETKGYYGRTLIHNASFNGQIEIVKYLYETCHADVETKNNYGSTPINRASFNGHVDVVKYLFETCHAYIETRDINECTPINNASRSGHLEVVKYLVETCHADVETRDNSGYTPINNASKKGHIEIVKYLYETCHANIETKDKYGRTPINIASLNDKLKVVKYLYETCHANVETKDNEGNTPINNASENGHLEVVKYLVETCHANVEKKDFYR